MEELLRLASTRVALLAEAAAVIIAAWGTVEAFIRLMGVAFRGATHGARKEVWRRFGMWLVLALEFELAGDIIRSVVAPSWQDIGELAAIALIRTFLNYFLEKDLETAG